MNNGFRWAALVGVLLLAASVGVIAYNAGIENGIERSGKMVVPPGAAAPYPYYWHHHHWGGGFFFLPLFGLFFFVFVMRGLFWRRGWHHHHHCHYGCYEKQPQEPMKDA